MRKILAIAFFLLVFCGFAFLSYKAINSWLSVSSGQGPVIFDGNDTKLMLGWLAIAAAAVHFVLWPEQWSMKERKTRKKLDLKNALFVGIVVTGILGLHKAIFAGGYLTRAEDYARAHGYTIVCDEISYKYGKKLTMAKSAGGCKS